MLEIKKYSISGLDFLKGKKFILKDLEYKLSLHNIGISKPFKISNKIINELLIFNEINDIFSNKSLEIITKIFKNNLVAFASFGRSSNYLNSVIENPWNNTMQETFIRIFIKEDIEIIPLQEDILTFSNYSSAILGEPNASIKTIDELFEKRQTLYYSDGVNKFIQQRYLTTDQDGRVSNPVNLDILVLRTLFSWNQVYLRNREGQLKPPNQLGISPGLIAKLIQVLLKNNLIYFIDNNFTEVDTTKICQELFKNSLDLIEHFKYIINTIIKNKLNINFQKEYCTETGDWMSIWNDNYVADLILYLSFLNNSLGFAISTDWHNDIDNPLLVNPSHSFGKYGPLNHNLYFIPVYNLPTKIHMSDNPALDLNKLLLADFDSEWNNFIVLNLLSKSAASFR